MNPLTTLLTYSLGAYILDVLVRPTVVADLARAAATRRNKPLLNVGAGTPSSSLRAALLGPTLWGDVNVDIAGSGPHSPTNVSYADIHALPFPTKAFGAAIASHVLEHVTHPALALTELQRVADEVFIITPPWWAPHTWLHPDHRWYVGGDGAIEPLWQPHNV